jgi:hypothetical protein
MRCSTSGLPAQYRLRAGPHKSTLDLVKRLAQRSRVAGHPYRLGDSMDTRTIAIAALVIAIIIAVVLFVL